MLIFGIQALELNSRCPIVLLAMKKTNLNINHDETRVFVGLIPNYLSCIFKYINTYIKLKLSSCASDKRNDNSL